MKYDIDKQFSLIAHFKPPMYKWVMTIGNAFLGMFRPFSNKKVKVEKQMIASFDGKKIKLYIISPKNEEKIPCMLYLHGGGFVMKASPYQFSACKEYAYNANIKVAFPDYRLAPKNAYPTPVKDAFSAYNWLLNNAEKLNIDKSNMIIGGDSAGGNLAAATAMMARDSDVIKPIFQMLIYPVIDNRMKTKSMQEFVDTPMWNARLNKKMWKWYLKEKTQNIEYASPIQAKLEGLPDAYIETAEFDCLRDEGEEYAAELRKAGAEVEYYQTKGTVHGFEIIKNAKITRQSIEMRIKALKKAIKLKKPE